MQELLTTVHFQKFNLQYQAFAFFEIVPSAPIMMVVASTLVALWILLILSARSRYLSTFSYSVVRIFWSVGTAISRSVHSCVPLRTTVLPGRLCFSRLPAVQIVISKIILAYISILFNWKGLMVVTLVSIL